MVPGTVQRVIQGRFRGSFSDVSLKRGRAPTQAEGHVCTEMLPARVWTGKDGQGDGGVSKGGACRGPWSESWSQAGPSHTQGSGSMAVRSPT